MLPLAPRRGTDFLGNKIYFDYSPPILGLPELPIHHVVREVEKVLKTYKIDLPRYYNTYDAPTKTRSRFRYNKFYHSQQNVLRARKRRIESGLFRKSFKRKGRFSRYGSYYSNRPYSRSYYG